MLGGDTMTKSDLVLEVARIAGIDRRAADTVVTAVFERITEALAKGERFELRGLGTFEVRQRSARVGRNPRTGARIQVPVRKVPFFRMGKELRAILNPPGVPERVHA
jgi:integration host factor subunit beta